MSKIISGTSDVTYTLSPTGFFAVTNPVSISPTGVLTNTTSGFEAIYGEYQAWTVTNSGLIAGRNTGVSLTTGGTVANRIIGVISGADYGIDVQGPGGSTVTNAGEISGTSAVSGVGVRVGGTVINQITGTIDGGKIGVRAVYDGAVVTNAGAISGAADWGIAIVNGGTAANQALGMVSGGKDGIYIAGGSGTVTNDGSIAGTAVAGVWLNAGGSLANQNTGTISGNNGVYVYQTARGTIMNAGVISGTGRYGLWLRGGGTVINQNTGTISGSEAGISLGGASQTVVNAGTIVGVTTAVELSGGGTNRVIVDPGAVFSGGVDGGNSIGGTSVSTLELASGAAPGLLSGLGTQFINFTQIAIDAGASWTLTGANTVAAGITLTNDGALTIFDGSLSDAGSVINNGLIEDDPSTMTLASLTGSGEVLIGGGSTLTLGGAVAATETIAFGGTGLLALDPTTFSGQIDGLGGGGRIELIGITDATAAVIVNANTLAIQQSSGPTLVLTLDPEESYAGFQFSFSTIAGTEVLSAAGPAGATIISQGETDTVSGSVGTELAANSGGVGGITVTGAESVLTTTTGTFTVGASTPGTLEIDDGGSVRTASRAIVANQSGAGGSSANVTGAGSDWQVGGALDIGNADTGVLAITDGATVTAATVDAGVETSGAGIVTVSGPDADLVTTGTVSVGDAGSGELSILNGANATIGGDLNVANAGTGTGNVDIEDTTGTITFGGNIFVGFNGFGVFNVGFNVDYIQNNGGIIFGPDSSGAINSFADPSPFLSNSSPSPISIGAQGVDQLAAYLFNSGEFTIPNNHSLTFETPIISGGGSFALGSGDSLVLNADTVTGQTFTLGSNDKLTIGIDQLATIDLPASGTGPFTPEVNPNKGDLLLGNFGGVIANFSSGDTIDVDTYLSSAAAGTLSQNGSVVSVIEIANGATLGVLTFDTAANATAAIAHNAITLVPCFAAGTRIATARGEVAVEAIEVGDRVQVLLGGGFSEVIWVGRREVDCACHAQPRKVWPVRVAAGAFGPGRPHADVWLSPDHAVFVGEVLVPIKHLINGSTIAQMQVDRVTYHHIELAGHNVLLAEGLAAESFLDMRDSSKYANRPGPTRLYPDYSARIWEAFGCARLVVAGPELVEARALVAGFAAERVAA